MQFQHMLRPNHTHTHSLTSSVPHLYATQIHVARKMKSGLEQNTNEWWCVRVRSLHIEREWGQVWWKAIHAWKIQIEFFHSIYEWVTGCACAQLMWISIRTYIRKWIVGFSQYISKLQLIQLWRLSYSRCIQLFFCPFTLLLVPLLLQIKTANW